MNASRVVGAALVLSGLLLTAAAQGSISPRKEQLQTELTTGAADRCRPGNPGKTTKDYEVVFGRRRQRVGAYLLLRRVRRGGFPKARIEREDCIFEVAIIFLTKHRAERIARRAEKAGWAVRIMVS